MTTLQPPERRDPRAASPSREGPAAQAKRPVRPTALNSVGESGRLASLAGPHIVQKSLFWAIPALWTRPFYSAPSRFSSFTLE